MKENEDKEKAQKTRSTTLEDSKSVEELAKAILEGMRERPRESLDPFEIYVDRIKAKLFANPEQFCRGFAQGYQVLLNNLKHLP